MKISESVSNGHPDKIADIISSDLLDYCLQQDPDTRFAVEVQIKGNIVNLAGEVSTKAEFTYAIIQRLVKSTLECIGYDEKYCQRWKMPTLSKNVHVNSYITVQSPEIAQGLAKGYGDQGIFFGQARKDYGYFSRDYWIAKGLCEDIYKLAKKDPELGLDIKTLAVCDDYDRLRKLVIAVPMLPGKESSAKSKLGALIARYSSTYQVEVIVNGTGDYHIHGPLVDCGMTGRKLAADFYGGSCKVGGGSPWTKDGTKADLSLNLLARFLAVKWMLRYHNTEEVNVAIACAIGSPRLEICYRDGDGHILQELSLDVPPSSIIEGFSLNKPIYGDLCRKGLFTGVDHLAKIATISLNIPRPEDVGL